MYRINAGKYRNPVKIQDRSTAQDSYGGSSETWVDVYSTRAGIFPLTGTEKTSADTITAEVTHRVHLRFLPNIKPKMRILYDGRVFNITFISNVQERNVELQLYCKEIVK